MGKPDIYFKLYVLNDTPACQTAIDRLNEVLHEILGDKYRVEVIDLERYPELAEEAQILAIPTLIKEAPTPTMRLVGDLSNTDTLASHLGR